LATEFPTVPRRPSNGCEGYALIGDCDAIAKFHVLIVHTLFDPLSTKDCLALPCLAQPCPALPRPASPRPAKPNKQKNLALPCPAPPRLAQPCRAAPSPVKQEATLNNRQAPPIFISSKT
jgi:hypothetical protein